MIMVFCGIRLAIAVSFWFVSFLSWKPKLFLFSLLCSGFQGVRFLVYSAWLSLFQGVRFLVYWAWLSLPLICFQFSFCFPVWFCSIARLGCEKKSNVFLLNVSLYVCYLFRVILELFFVFFWVWCFVEERYKDAGNNCVMYIALIYWLCFNVFEFF